jgi:hypothetical protein
MTEIWKLGLQTSAEAKIFYAAFLSNAEDILTQAEIKAVVEKYAALNAPSAPCTRAKLGARLLLFSV